MNNDLHLKITSEAVKRLKAKGVKMPSAVRSTELVVVEIDIYDTLPTLDGGEVYSMGHNSPSAQHRHFMRTSGQTNDEALRLAVSYIKEQATLAARDFRSALRQAFNKNQFVCEVGVTTALNSPAGSVGLTAATAGMIYKGQRGAPLALNLRKYEIPTSLCTAALPLGLAAHTLEDSFSPSHVVRDGRVIRSIEVYAAQDHDDHDKKDASTVNKESAIEAVMDLFVMVNNSVKSNIDALIGWDGFETKWLKLKSNAESTPLTSTVPVGKPVAIQKHATMSTLNLKSHHTVKGGESLSSIAGIYYKDVLLWPHILDHNKNSIRNPNNLARGMLINIPPIPQSSDLDALRQRGRNWRSYNAA